MGALPTLSVRLLHRRSGEDDVTRTVCSQTGEKQKKVANSCVYQKKAVPLRRISKNTLKIHTIYT